MAQIDTEALEIDQFHIDFDAETRTMMEPIREAMLDFVHDRRLEQEDIIAQFIMEHLNPHPCDAGYDPRNFPNGILTPEHKMRLVKIANHMGPDYAQALYHAAVFITKVA